MRHPTPAMLLDRLNGIGTSLAQTECGLALIGLGSMGQEQERIDAYSDLDFFAIVEPGGKQQMLNDLGWLAAVCPIAYCYRNTADGYKLLFEDGVFCEFAVFELAELPHIPYAPGRVVWKRPETDAAALVPLRGQAAPAAHSIDWLVGETLTCLYTGLCRNARGERLSAMRMIQVLALDRLLELCTMTEPEPTALPDPFSFERRYEQRFPAPAQALPALAQGYEHNIESALAILAELEKRATISRAMKQAILELCANAAVAIRRV